jgi:hypothetical protein
MRNLRFGLCLAAIACTFAVTASAMAQEFVASREPVPLSEEKPGKTKGYGIASEGLEAERNQFFKFGPFEIVCTAIAHANTIAEGAVSWESSPTFATLIKYNKCLTKAHFGSFVAGLQTAFNINPETKKQEPLKFVYHVNGFAETGTGETESEVEVGSGEATFKISQKVCKISWPAQTVPATAVAKPEGEFSAVTYSNNFVPVEETATNLKRFPTLEQERLVILHNLKGMEWHFEEGQCLGEGGFEQEAKTTEGKTAQYKGATEEQVVNGNLGFE